MKLNNIDLERIAITAMIAVMICFSIFVYSKKASSAEKHAATIQSFDDNIENVLELTAAAAAASTVITALPGDLGTPIAEKVADFTGYFMIVLSALYLEKYLVTVGGYLAFVFLIPMGLAFLGLFLYFPKRSLLKLSKKFLLFGIVIYLAIPFSAKISELIYSTYSVQIDSTISSVSEMNESLDEEKSSTNGLSELNIFNNSSESLIAKAKAFLNNMINAFAVMLVTSCLIPVVVLLFLIWVVKIISGQDFLSSVQGLLN